MKNFVNKCKKVFPYLFSVSKTNVLYIGIGKIKTNHFILNKFIFLNGLHKDLIYLTLFFILVLSYII